MSPRRLRIEQALDLVPELDELLPLRATLIGAAREDEERAWAASSAYGTLGQRLVDADALEAEIPALAERIREHTEALYRQVARALRAVDARDYTAAAEAMIAAGELEEGERRLAAAERYYRKALELGRKPRERRAEGLALRRLGRVARLSGELGEAARLYRAGLEVAEAERDGEGEVVACQGLGNIAVDQGLWQEAHAWYTRGLTRLSPKLPERLRWQLCNNLAVVTLRSGALAESEEWVARALEAVREDDTPGCLAVQNTLGRLRMAQGRAAEAEVVYRAALAAEPGPFTRSSLLVNLCDALLAQARLADAEAAARQAETVAIRNGGVLPLLDAYRALGAVARARRDAEGFLFFEQALKLCRVDGLPAVELAATQHAYGLAQLDFGQAEEGCARLREALGAYEELGSTPEAEQIRSELARIRGE